jgi:antirestriction protein ArdC
MEKEKKSNALQQISEQIEEGVKKVLDGEEFKKYLKTMSKFYNYSSSNIMLIYMQKPDATYVAGYTSWLRNFGRQVKKGEKGIRIIAPCIYKVQKDENGIESSEKQLEKTIFRPVSVFDISQTEGRELELFHIDSLKGELDNYMDFLKVLYSVSPVPVKFGEFGDGISGSYSPDNHVITLQKGMSDRQTVKTLTHEIAHSIFHNPSLFDNESGPERPVREIQAESIAYTVLQHYGIDSGSYTFPYLASWSESHTIAELKSSMNDIRKYSAQLIDSIETRSIELGVDLHSEQKISGLTERSTAHEHDTAER